MNKSNTPFSLLNNIPTELIENLISKSLRKLNLISREEFDIQTKVLHRTREKIELLEKKISLLEKQAKKVSMKVISR